MTKHVIAVEGSDGSGKSTVIQLIGLELEARGLKTQVIGRNAGDGTTVGTITDVIRSNVAIGGDYDLDIALRIAREFCRASAASTASADVVLLDRFVLSDESRAKMNGALGPFVYPALMQCAQKSGLTYTVFCDCPFPVSWSRVLMRSDLSAKESLGEVYNRELHNLLSTCAREFVFQGSLVRVDTSSSLEVVRSAVASFVGGILF